jgi:hypothetical protein
MNSNQDGDKTSSNPTGGREKAADDKANADERRDDSDKAEKRGGKDDTVLGEINDD